MLHAEFLRPLYCKGRFFATSLWGTRHFEEGFGVIFFYFFPLFNRKVVLMRENVRWVVDKVVVSWREIMRAVL